MKIKNIGFMQKYIEKIALVVCALAAIAILLLYQVRDPLVFDDKGTKKTADQIENELEKAIQELEAEIRENAPSHLPKMQLPHYTEQFIERWARNSVDSTPSKLSLGDHGLGPDLGDSSTLQQYHYAVPKPAAASEVIVRADYAVLLPDQQLTLQSTERFPSFIDRDQASRRGEYAAAQYAKLVDSKQPRDFTYVSVMAEFPMDQWRKLLTQSPLPSDGKIIREAWWRSRLCITSIVLERQPLDIRTGQWGPTKRIDPLPDQIVFREDLSKYSRSEANQLIGLVRQAQDIIAQPDFAPIETHKPWLPPDSDIDSLSPSERRELQRLLQRTTMIQKQIIRLQKQTEEGAERQQRTDDRLERKQSRRVASEGQRSGSGGGPGLLSGAGGGAGPPGVSGAGAIHRSNGDAAKLAALQQQLNIDLARIDELLGSSGLTEQFLGKDRQKKYGFMAGAEPSFAGGGPLGVGGGLPGPGLLSPMTAPDVYGGGPMAFPETRPSAKDGDEPTRDKIDVWAHDLSVEPGVTYRYRIIVKIMNPLLKRGSQLTDEQRAQYADLLSLESEASEWVQVKVPPTKFFFLVNASVEQQQASVEVWRVYNGRPFKQIFDVGPGQPIGSSVTIDINGESAMVDLYADAVVVDLVSDRVSGNRYTTERRTMLYSNSLGNQLLRRTVDQDRNSNERNRWQLEDSIADGIAEAIEDSNKRRGG